MRQCSRAIIIKDNQLLLMKRKQRDRQFYSLVGGAIEPGETPEQALTREVYEETSIEIAKPRLVIIEDDGDYYGIQHIFLADYKSGEIAIQDNTDESRDNQQGDNTYQPQWVNLSELGNTSLLPSELKQSILQGLTSGFPDQPIKLKTKIQN
ncbi:MAG: NUDIX domain-containing protein [bacterium]